MYTISKRIMDVFLSFLAIVILSPVLFLIVLILKFTGEGEVFIYNIGLVTKIKCFQFINL